MVERYPEKNWDFIASQLPGRNRRQCRERWKHYLSGDKTKPWTHEDDELLLKKYAEIGPKWSLISSFFESRTDTQIKNRWQKLSLSRLQQNQTINFQDQISQNYINFDNSINSQAQIPLQNSNQFSINNIYSINNDYNDNNYNNKNLRQVTFGEIHETNNNNNKYNLNVSLPIINQNLSEESHIARPPSIPLTLYANDAPNSFLEDIDNDTDSFWYTPNERQCSEYMSSFPSFPN